MSVQILNDDQPMVVEVEETTPDDGSDDLVHICCECSEDVALCGGYLGSEVDEFSDDELCVVCADLEKQPCPRCGEMP